MGLVQSLREITDIINAEHAVVNDAVRSEEALDRIIRSLMETNPDLNAAPPACRKALEKLQREDITVECLEKYKAVKCTICIEDFVTGQCAALLPCNHPFHEGCVVPWLKMHNTCPMCRAPVTVGEDQHAIRDSSGRGGESSCPARPYPGLAPSDDSSSSGSGCLPLGSAMS